MGSAEQLQRGPSRPWQLGWQMNERNLVWNDDLKLRLIKVGGPHAGLFALYVCPLEDLAHPPTGAGANSFKVPSSLLSCDPATLQTVSHTLLQRVAAEELGVSEEDMESRLQALQALLPDMVGRLPNLKPQLIAQLASDPQARPLGSHQLHFFFSSQQSQEPARQCCSLVGC